MCAEKAVSLHAFCGTSTKKILIMRLKDLIAKRERRERKRTREQRNIEKQQAFETPAK
jgi:hypothetical protein